MSSVKVDEGEPGDAEGWHTVQPGQHQEEKKTNGNEAVRTTQWLGEGGRMGWGRLCYEQLYVIFIFWAWYDVWRFFTTRHLLWLYTHGFLP